MSLSEKKLILEKMKVLQAKTGLSYQLCKIAFEKNDLDIDRALLWLKENKTLQSVTVNELIEKCSGHAVRWAREFLDETLDSGELKSHYEAGEMDIIQSNYFFDSIAGMPGNCPFLLFKEEMKYFTNKENDEFDSAVQEMYNNAVKQLLPEYILPEWKLPEIE